MVNIFLTFKLHWCRLAAYSYLQLLQTTYVANKPQNTHLCLYSSFWTLKLSRPRGVRQVLRVRGHQGGLGMKVEPCIIHALLMPLASVLLITVCCWTPRQLLAQLQLYSYSYYIHKSCQLIVSANLIIMASGYSNSVHVYAVLTSIDCEQQCVLVQQCCNTSSVKV